MVNISKAHGSNFQVIFPLIPTTSSASDDDCFKLNISGTIIPGIAISDVEVPGMGTKTYMESGIEYDPGTVKYDVDSDFDNYFLLYNGMMYIYDGKNRFGREMDLYQIEADIILTDNGDNEHSVIRLSDIWPISLEQVDLSYDDAGSEKIESTVTFRYDHWTKL